MSESSNNNDKKVASDAIPIDYWNNRWLTNQTRWHKYNTNPLLEQYIHKLPQPNDNYKPRILVPLCGKTLDLVYLALRGYHVIGIEYVESAILTFFNENTSIIQKFQSNKLANTNITQYKAIGDNKLNLEIYQCDIFDTNLTSSIIGGYIDCLWDRGSFVAINKNDRIKYIQLIVKLLNPNYKQSKQNTNSDNDSNNNCIEWLLNVVTYPSWEKNTTPLSVTDKQLRQLLTAVATNKIDNNNTIISNTTPKPNDSDIDSALQDEIAIENKSSICGGLFECALLYDEIEENINVWKLSIARDRVYAITRLSTAT